MKILFALTPVLFVACSCGSDDPEPVGTLSPIEEFVPPTTLGTSLDDEMFGLDWCQAVKQHYGDVDGLLEYMNEGNPTGVPPEVEEQARAAYEDCDL